MTRFCLLPALLLPCLLHAQVDLPVFGKLFQKVGLSRFSKTCSTMIKAGVPILGTLEIVADTSGNRIIAEACSKTVEQVTESSRRDFWLDAGQALEYGLVTKVVKKRDELPE